MKIKRYRMRAVYPLSFLKWYFGTTLLKINHYWDTVKGTKIIELYLRTK